MKKIITVSLLSLMLAACGGGGSGGNNNSSSVVNYSISDDGVQCPTADSQSSADDLIQCAWNCAVNNLTAGADKGVTGLWSITFARKDSGWYLFRDVVRTPCP